MKYSVTKLACWNAHLRILRPRLKTTEPTIQRTIGSTNEKRYYLEVEVDPRTELKRAVANPVRAAKAKQDQNFKARRTGATSLANASTQKWNGTSNAFQFTGLKVLEAFVNQAVLSVGKELTDHPGPGKRTRRPGNEVLPHITHIGGKPETVVSKTTPGPNAQEVIELIAHDRWKTDLKETAVVATGKPQLSASTVPKVTSEVVSSLVETGTVVIGIVVVEIFLGFFLGGPLSVSSQGAGTEQEQE